MASNVGQFHFLFPKKQMMEEDRFWYAPKFILSNSVRLIT